MSVTVKNETPKMKRYRITGTTLAETWKAIKKKGPKDPNDNKRVAALTTTQIRMDAGRATFKKAGSVRTLADGSLEVTAKFDRFQITHTAEIQLPNHMSRLNGVKAKLEWARFMTCLVAHEMCHVKLSQDEAEKIRGELDALRGAGSGATERDAAMAAIADLLKQYKAYDKEISKRLKKVHKKLDHSSGHGPVLKTSIGA